MSATRAVVRRTRRVGTSVAVAVALTISLAACGVPTDNEVHRINPGRVPNHLIAPSPTPASPVTR